MKSVGEILREERLKQNQSVEEIHRATKIPLATIEKIEKDLFNELPATAFSRGFVRNYAQSLGLDKEKTLAIYRRDWEKKGQKTPLFFKKDQGLEKTIWNPKTLGFIVGGLLILVLAGYLGFQLKNYFSPPKLVVEQPMDGEKIGDDQVEVKGKTDKEASLYINEQLIDIDEQGNFLYSLDLYPGENKIEIKAVDRRERETVVERKVVVD
jgi:cytoskeletal protein RodZ